MAYLLGRVEDIGDLPHTASAPRAFQVEQDGVEDELARILAKRPGLHPVHRRRRGTPRSPPRCRHLAIVPLTQRPVAPPPASAAFLSSGQLTSPSPRGSPGAQESEMERVPTSSHNSPLQRPRPTAQGLERALFAPGTRPARIQLEGSSWEQWIAPQRAESSLEHLPRTRRAVASRRRPQPALASPALNADRALEPSRAGR